MQVFFFFDIRLQFMQPVSTTGACFSTTLCTEPAFGYFNSKWFCQHTIPCCALFTLVLLVKVSLNNSLSAKKICVSTTLYIKHTFGYFLSIKKSATNKSGRFCVLLACIKQIYWYRPDLLFLRVGIVCKWQVSLHLS